MVQYYSIVTVSHGKMYIALPLFLPPTVALILVGVDALPDICYLLLPELYYFHRWVRKGLKRKRKYKSVVSPVF
jgi:hypothetical protein